MGIFDKLRSKTKQKGIPKLVIGINQVDNLGEWDNDINQPTPETEKKIEERVNDIIEKLTSGNHGASKDQIEYFSALRAYRLPHVINKIVHCTGVISTFKPKDITDPTCSIGMSQENRDEINQMLKEQRKANKTLGLDDFLCQLLEKVSQEDREKLQKVINDKKSKPINVAIIGQSGVGKSTTVNNLFGAEEVVSRTTEGTTEKNFKSYKEYSLPDGSIMRVADLPGYGRGLKEDEKYKSMYINTLKGCDVILLVIQANDKAIADDQYMIECLYEWSKEGLLTDENSYYGQNDATDILNDKEKSNVAEEKNMSADSKESINYINEISILCDKALKEYPTDSKEFATIKAIIKLL